eukprot:3935975-Rhodomonas_salina.1
MTWMPAANVPAWDIACVNACFTHSCANNSYCLRKTKAPRPASWQGGPQPGTAGDRCHYCRFGFHANNWLGKSAVPTGEAGIQPCAKGTDAL